MGTNASHVTTTRKKHKKIPYEEVVELLAWFESNGIDVRKSIVLHLPTKRRRSADLKELKITPELKELLEELKSKIKVDEIQKEKVTPKRRGRKNKNRQ